MCFPSVEMLKTLDTVLGILLWLTLLEPGLWTCQPRPFSCDTAGPHVTRGNRKSSLQSPGLVRVSEGFRVSLCSPKALNKAKENYRGIFSPLECIILTQKGLGECELMFISLTMVPDFLFQGNPAGFGTTPASEHPEPGFRSWASPCLLFPSVFVFLVTRLYLGMVEEWQGASAWFLSV